MEINDVGEADESVAHEASASSAVLKPSRVLVIAAISDITEDVSAWMKVDKGYY